MKEGLQTKELPFKGLKVYYSGSIAGVKETDPNFAWNLVEYMKLNGANVLSEHVAARNQEEMDKIRAKNMGLTVEEMNNDKEPWFAVRKQDLTWVHQATHVVALVNAPSHGVGMEIQEAIRKPQLGMNETPILCLVHKDVPRLTFMIKGINQEEAPNFSLKTYNDLEEAKKIIKDFLAKTSIKSK
jgi:hypothetical protein